jgi:hypothetical protein
MERVVNKARNFREAGEWDVTQQVNLTPEQRQEISRALKERFYGRNNVDVRERRKFAKRKLSEE